MEHNPALDRWFELAYGELQHLARSVRSKDWSDRHRTASLIHEAYLRVRNCEEIGTGTDLHKFRIIARVMRNFLIDSARREKAKKRGGDFERASIPLDEIPDQIRTAEEWLDLDDALQELSEFDERKAELVQLKFFGGFTFEEAAEALEISEVTARRDWAFSRAWILRRASGEK